MIVTITPNPAIDQINWVDQRHDAKSALLTRADKTRTSVGGKGINVSILLNRLGVETTAMGFTAGYTGHTIGHLLHAEKISTNFVWTDDESRTNVIIIEKGNEASPFEVNAQGPRISQTALKRFMRRYKNALRRTECVMYGGSLPPSLPADFYRELMRLAHTADAKTILYASGEPFAQACALGPWICKPDVREQTKVLGASVCSREQAYQMGKELLQTGSEIVVLAYDVTQPVASQLLLTRAGAWAYGAESVELNNRVGAGDAFIAGLLFKLLRGHSIDKAGHFGMAASIASSESEGTMASGRSAIERASKRVKVEAM